MLAAFVLARASLRRRRGSLLGLAVVVALGLGVAIASFEAADRTHRAYPSFLQRSEVGHLVVNPSLATAEAERIIASTPGVRRYVSSSLLTASPDDGAPRTQAEIDTGAMQVHLSSDGRYVEADRPAIRDGRMVRDGAEAFVNVEMAEALGLNVGDTLPLAFWSSGYTLPEPADPDGLQQPLGRTEVRIVGIGVLSDEVLVDGLYPRQRVIVTPEVGAPFDCILRQPGPDDERSLDELAAFIIPPGCAMSYRYYSLGVDGGDGGVGAVADAIAQRLEDETNRLPAALLANNIGYESTPTVTADERRRVAGSLQPAVRALQLFGLAAVASTVVLGLLGAVRIARRDETDARVWRDLGAARGVRATAIALPVLVAVLAGLLGALVLGWLASGLGPVASARAVEPAGRLGLSGAVVATVLGVSAAVLGAGVALAAALACRRTSQPATQPGASSTSSGAWLSRMAARAAAGSPTVVLGVRATTAGAGGRALLGASVGAVTAVLATLVFSESLGGLVADPEKFGWPFDVAATVNYGYGGTSDTDAIAATLDGRPEVEQWALAILSGGVTIGDQTVPVIAAGRGFGAMPMPVVDGELPEAEDEIALGALTARRLGIGVGARVPVGTVYGGREAMVSGIVVLPPVGPFQADRAALGTGALLSERFQRSILESFEQEQGMEDGLLADVSAGLIGIRLRDGVDPDAFVAAIAAELPTWDFNGAPPFVYTEPVRPATVANVASMRTLPLALAGLLALTMAIGLALAIAVATRARRRELAVLRALGCVGDQLRATVRWQALTVVLVGLVVGVPVGLAGGRLAYRAFANGLGVVPDPTIHVRWVLIVAAMTVAIGLLAAAVPARRAARVPAAQTLRNP